MEKLFFKKQGLLYIPVHMAGWLLILISVAACLWFFIAIDRNSHSASDSLIHFFVYATAVAFWFKWIADATSGEE
jgi:hypothetical protein